MNDYDLTYINNDTNYIMQKIAEEYLKNIEIMYKQKFSKIEELIRDYEKKYMDINSLARMQKNYNRIQQIQLILTDFSTIFSLEKELNEFKSTYFLNPSIINFEAMQEALKNLLENTIITNKFYKSVTSYSLDRIYESYLKYDYTLPSNSNNYSFVAANMLYSSLKEKKMLDLSDYYPNYKERLKSIVLPTTEENKKPQKLDYSEIKKKIINEYKKELVSEYNSIITQKAILQEKHNKATSSFRQFNEAVAEKGINARIQYSYDIQYAKPIAIAVIFNNLFGIPFKDEYEYYMSCNNFELNPVKNIQKIKLIMKLRTMTDDEWELLRIGIKEHEDNNDLKIKISDLYDEADEYHEKYINDRFNIKYDILEKVVNNMYNEGIITDELLIETMGDKENLESNDINSPKKLLTKLINHLENNMACDDEYLSSNIDINSDTKKATINKERTMSLPSRRRISL